MRQNTSECAVQRVPSRERTKALQTRDPNAFCYCCVLFVFPRSMMQVDVTELGGNSPRVDVVEVTKGVSPLEGTVSLSYRDSFTQDLAFDASSEEVSRSMRRVLIISACRDPGAGWNLYQFEAKKHAVLGAGLKRPCVCLPHIFVLSAGRIHLGPTSST